jgi:hypothetical protein
VTLERAWGVLAVDVDGPLNPYMANPKRRPDGYQSYRLTDGGDWYSGRDVRRHKGMLVWLHPDHGGQLLQLAADTGLELVWATTWGADANRLVAPAIGLPDLPVIDFCDADLDASDRRWRGTGRWKWSAVADYADGRPLAWLDDEHDDMAYQAGRADFAHARTTIPTQLCHVDPRTGILSSHLDDIRSWSTTHRPAAATGT